jgi:hypothetical protein
MVMGNVNDTLRALGLMDIFEDEKIEQDKIYFEFPLCLLSLEENFGEICNIIIAYSVLQYASEFTNISKYSELMKIGSKNFCIIFPANKSLTINRYHLSIDYAEEIEMKYGKDAMCRVGKRFLFDMLKRNEEILFRTYCAIQSKIGKKALVKKIYREELQVRVLGYKCRQMNFQENAIGFTISLNQIDYAIKKLTQKSMVAKITVNRCRTYYSTRICGKELRDKVYLFESNRRLKFLEHNMKLKF